MTGKRIICIILLCVCMLMFSGCNSIYKTLSDGTEKILGLASDSVGNIPKDAALDVMNTINEIGGNSVLTSDNSLQGERTIGTDNYVGTYSAEYEDFSKTEYLFGGTSIDREAGKEISITCTLEVTNGKAKVFWLSGADEPTTLLKTTGTYSDTITIPDGGNYIGIECDSFTGNIELNIE